MMKVFAASCSATMRTLLLSFAFLSLVLAPGPVKADSAALIAKLSIEQLMLVDVSSGSLESAARDNDLTATLFQRSCKTWLYRLARLSNVPALEDRVVNLKLKSRRRRFSARAEDVLLLCGKNALKSED